MVFPEYELGTVGAESNPAYRVISDMRISFLGDISVNWPNSKGNRYGSPFERAEYVIANLEGAIVNEVDAASLPHRKPLALYNSLDVLDILRIYNVRAVCLANNHMYDLGLPASQTKKILQSKGIASFGAGYNLEEASQPLVLYETNTTIKIFAFGWDVIGCHLASKNSEGVNPLTPAHLLATIRDLRRDDQSSFVIFIMHWNYELELYPQPAHRELAHSLINEGVDAIIGLHPHVVQGAELVNGKPVVYSLGNWFFPQRRLGHFILKYPSVSNRELALDITNRGRKVQNVRFHWYQFDAERNQIVFEKTESWDGEILKKLTPFVGMSHTEYIKWFKHHRARRRGLPVYTTYQDTWENLLKDSWVRTRQFVIRVLLLLKLRNRLRS